MIGSTAVIYTPGQTPPVQVYDITAKSEAGVQVSNTFPIDDIVTDDAGFTFSRAASPDFDPTGAFNVLFARSDNSPTLAYHGTNNKSGALLDLAGGEGGAAVSVGPTQAQRNTHGVLMTIGWGILIPLGIVLAASMRWRAPLWFQLHRAVQTTGLIFALAGFILALVEFDV